MLFTPMRTNQVAINNEFFKSLDLPISWKLITLIDFDNSHGIDMYSLLSNSSLYPALENRFRLKWEKLHGLEDLPSLLSNRDTIYCIPLCWETKEYNDYIIESAKKNIIIAPFDNIRKYPWSLSGVFCANKNLAWDYSDITHQQHEVSGYSVDTVILSIIALKGKQFLTDFLNKGGK